MIVGPPDTLYEGGFFGAKLTFPDDFPNKPPEMRFTSPMWHPNGVYCGRFRVCVLLLSASSSHPAHHPTRSPLRLPPLVYDDGKVCISILHPPGDDATNPMESAIERWRPILGVEQIVVSVISMLSDPNDDSPANIDAAVMWRNDRAAFKRRVRDIVRRSQEAL